MVEGEATGEVGACAPVWAPGAPGPAPGWSFSRDGLCLTPLSRPFVPELFCGSGRLTASLRALGLDAWGIDWRGGKLTPETPALIMINVLAPEDQAALARLLDHPMLRFLHMAPPCGTASRARDKPVGPGRHGPPRLRSEEFPLGLPTLSRDHPELVPRVQAANTIYIMCANAARICRDRNIAWSLENPRESYMWWVPEVAKLIGHSDVDFVRFQNCAFGGQRPKWSSLLHFPKGIFSDLARVCPGEGPAHRHAPWGESEGKFATSLETVYPSELCSAMAKCLVKFLRFTPCPPPSP